jgi:glucose/arabinose dehydrogenase
MDGVWEGSMTLRNLEAVRVRAARVLAFVLASALSLAPSIPAQASDEEEVGFASAMPGPGPFRYETAELPEIRVDVVARGLAHGYSLAFLPGGDALIVERGLRLRLLRQAAGESPQLEPGPIENAPSYSDIDQLHPDDVLGIQDVMPHPQFETNRLIYFTYNRPTGYDLASGRLTSATVLARARLDGLRLEYMADLLVGEAVVGTGGSRILFGPDDLLYVSVGALSVGDIESAQRTDNIYGKVLRIRADGAIPADNPFFGVEGARPEIWTYGHRDPLGLAIDRRSGRLLASEHGPQGGDEVNELLPGRNYGWPKHTYGTEYGGSRLPHAPVGPGTEGPLMAWMPAIAPNGIAIYTGDAMPAWKNNLFLASARRGQINGTGALVRVVLSEQLYEKRQEVLLGDLHQRFKDVRQGPDGLLYVLTDEDDSVLLRIGPSDSRKP